MFFISNARTGIVLFIKAHHVKNDRKFNGCFLILSVYMNYGLKGATSWTKNETAWYIKYWILS